MTDIVERLRYHADNEGWPPPLLTQAADEIERLRRLRQQALDAAARLRKERNNAGWQPIETAPKDGTQVLLYWPIWSDTPGIGCWLKNEWVVEGALYSVEGPTHWMPLPKAPETADD